MEEGNRLNDAFVYAKVAGDNYANIYGEDNEISIASFWLICSIAYQTKSKEIEMHCNKLFWALAKRDQILHECQGLEDG